MADHNNIVVNLNNMIHHTPHLRYITPEEVYLRDTRDTQTFAICIEMVKINMFALNNVNFEKFTDEECNLICMAALENEEASVDNVARYLPIRIKQAWIERANMRFMRTKAAI